MSSFQGVGIERFYYIQYTEVSSFQGVGIETPQVSSCYGVGVPLYTEVSSFQGVGMERKLSSDSNY